MYAKTFIITGALLPIVATFLVREEEGKRTSFYDAHTPHDAVSDGISEAISESQKHNLSLASKAFDGGDTCFATEESLVDFIHHLQSFVSDTAFSDGSFITEAEQLDLELSEAAKLVAKERHCADLPEMLVFARRVFMEMVEATENFQHYAYLGTTDQHLICCMSELNVRLLVLFDPLGVPNVRVHDYAKNVLRHSDLVSFWCQEFDNLNLVPIGARTIFKIYANRARESLKILAEQIQGVQPMVR